MITSCVINDDSKNYPDSETILIDDKNQIKEDIDQSLCVDNEKRSCHIILKNQSGMPNCFVGIQICVNNEWSECKN